MRSIVCDAAILSLGLPGTVFDTAAFARVARAIWGEVATAAL